MGNSQSQDLHRDQEVKKISAEREERDLQNNILPAHKSCVSDPDPMWSGLGTGELSCTKIVDIPPPCNNRPSDNNDSQQSARPG